jgi:hypothetical protein
LPRVGSEECHCSKFYPSRRAAFCLLTMSCDENEMQYVLVPRDAVQIEVNDDGCIAIIGSGGVEDPAVICIETQDVPKIIAALRQAVKDEKRRSLR